MVQLVLKGPTSSSKPVEGPDARSSGSSLQRLERSVLRLKVMLAVVATLALLPWVGVAQLWTRGPSFEQWKSTVPATLDLPCEIKARSFRAVAEGRELAFLGRSHDGSGNLTLRNDRGEQILVASDFDGHGGYVEVGNAKQINAHLGAGATPSGFLVLRNEQGTDIAYVGHGPKGDGQLHLDRADGKDLLTVGLGDHDESYLSLLGPAGTPSSVLVANDEGGRLDLYDASVRKILYAGPLEGGSGIVKVFDPEGTTLAAFGASGGDPVGGFFEAFGRNGLPLFYGGGDNRRGYGLLNVCNDRGGMLFAVGIDGNEQGGVLNVYDLAGEMVLRTPDWK